MKKSPLAKSKLNKLFFFDFAFSRNLFAGLIAYCATGLASRLTSASAFAATRGYSFLRNGNGLDSRHNKPSVKEFYLLCYYNKYKGKTQVFASYFFKLTARIPAIAPAIIPYAASNSVEMPKLRLPDIKPNIK